MGGFDPGCKLPRAHLMAGIDNVQSSAPGVACKYGLSLMDSCFDGTCKYVGNWVWPGRTRILSISSAPPPVGWVEVFFFFFLKYIYIHKYIYGGKRIKFVVQHSWECETLFSPNRLIGMSFVDIKTR